MTTGFGNEQDYDSQRGDDETFRSLLSIGQCIETEPPAELVERVREKLLTRVAASHGVERQASWRRKRPVWIATTALAAAVLVMAVTLMGRGRRHGAKLRRRCGLSRGYCLPIPRTTARSIKSGFRSRGR